jgi:hypothetical protein
VSVYLIKHHIMKTYGTVETEIHALSASAMDGGDWSVSRPGHFTLGTHRIGGWVGPRTSLSDVEKRKFLTVHGLELRPLDSPRRTLVAIQYV